MAFRQQRGRQPDMSDQELKELRASIAEAQDIAKQLGELLAEGVDLQAIMGDDDGNKLLEAFVENKYSKSAAMHMATNFGETMDPLVLVCYEEDEQTGVQQLLTVTRQKGYAPDHFKWADYWEWFKRSISHDEWEVLMQMLPKKGPKSVKEAFARSASLRSSIEQHEPRSSKATVGATVLASPASKLSSLKSRLLGSGGATVTPAPASSPFARLKKVTPAATAVKPKLALRPKTETQISPEAQEFIALMEQVQGEAADVKAATDLAKKVTAGVLDLAEAIETAKTMGLVEEA